MSFVQDKTASASAINAYVVLALSFLGLKTSFSKELLDFIPILFSVLLLILNNSIKYYNRTPTILAFLINLVLIGFFAKQLMHLEEESLWEIIRKGIMLLVSIIPIYFFVLLLKEKES